MQFHTWPFLIFFILTYGIYLALRRTPYWVHALLAASYVFYGWWRPEYLLLILYSTVLDYGCVEMMRRSERNRGWWLTVSIVNNLGILGFFKYAEFAAWNVNWLFQHYEIGYVLRVPDVLLPVGISFFTFQSMSYTIDFYRGRLDHEPSFVRFATFVAFFPQLVAGPIERASCLLPQMRKAPPITRQHLADGMSLFLTGLVKKIALADYLAAYSDPIYSDPANRSGSQLACATFAFAWQIYFDFSGYTDMARGVARVMGFDLMLNFNHPYLATGMKDFWSRWHISLSTWFRDYVYIPLGGNQSGRWLTYRNLMLTMIISGFGMELTGTFLIWGALHGIAYIALRPLEESKWWQIRVPTLVKQVIVFLFVCFTWIFFRAASVQDAIAIIQRMFTGGISDPGMPILAILATCSVWAYQWCCESSLRTTPMTSVIRIVVYVAITLYICLATGRVDQPFIYFQF